MEAHEIAGAIGVEIIGRLEHGEGTGARAAHTGDGHDTVLKLFAGPFDLSACPARSWSADLGTGRTAPRRLLPARRDDATLRRDPRALALYAAHMVLRQVDWSLRKQRAFETAWFMDTGAALLAAVGAG